MKLPPPKLRGDVSVEQAIANRRSIRSYASDALSLDEVSQLLWCAQGVTHDGDLRAAPSAGATLPMTVYLVAGDVDGLEPGVYRYQPNRHSLERTIEGDVRDELDAASLRQGMSREAPAGIVLAAEYERTTGRYGKRGIRYVHIEVGHIGQNISLQAEALGLATVAVGAFDDAAVKSVLQLDEEPLYIMPVGRKPGG